MKIVIIHYRYYEASGPEKYLFSISQLLEEKDHVVIPFSLNYAENERIKFAKYFPNPVMKQFHIYS